MGPTREFLDKYWVPANEGSILVTSQDSQWQFSQYIHHSLQLPCLTNEEGSQFIEKYLSRHGIVIQQAEAALILEESGGLPLALQHMLSYMVVEKLTAAEFLDEFQRSRVVDNWQSQQSLPSLATLFHLSMDKLDDPATKILQNLSFLAAKKIPEFLLGGTQGVPERSAASFPFHCVGYC